MNIWPIFFIPTSIVASFKLPLDLVLRELLPLVGIRSVLAWSIAQKEVYEDDFNEVSCLDAIKDVLKREFGLDIGMSILDQINSAFNNDMPHPLRDEYIEELLTRQNKNGSPYQVQINLNLLNSLRIYRHLKPQLGTLSSMSTTFRISFLQYMEQHLGTIQFFDLLLGERNELVRCITLHAAEKANWEERSDSPVGGYDREMECLLRVLVEWWHDDDDEGSSRVERAELAGMIMVHSRIISGALTKRARDKGILVTKKK